MPKIFIDLEVTDPETLRDIVTLIELQLGYMADNVLVTSHMEA